MERLTNRHPDGTAYVVSEAGTKGVGRLLKLITRLAAYEDTGLTPEEIKKLKDFTAANLNVNTCVCCGEIIPEGRQVCPACEKEAGL